jgi:curved DNA-binding protein CbpA
VLDLDEESSEKEIKQAYLTLTKKYHPDVCRLDNSSAIFKKITESYAILSNKQLRSQYSTLKSAAKSTGSGASEFQEDVYGSFAAQRQAKNNQEYNYWEEDRRSFDAKYKEWVRQGQQEREKESRERRAKEETESRSFTLKLGLFTVGAVCLYVGGFADFIRSLVGAKEQAAETPGQSNAVFRAIAPDGVLADSPTVVQARFSQVKKEFENKNIIIEVKPNKLHPKYQKLAKEPDHIKYINLVLSKANTGLSVVKSDSIYADSCFRRTLTLEEHRDMFHDFLAAKDSTDLEVAINKLRSGVESSGKANTHSHFDHQTGTFTPGNYI